MPETIRVFVADDHPIVRRGIKDLLDTEAAIVVVGEASDGREAVQKVSELLPDLVLMDLVMPGMDGIEATRRIRESHPQVRVLVLTSFATDDKIFPAIKAGAQGYLMKDTGPAELLEAIQRVQRGEPTLHPAIAQKLLAEISGPSSQPPTPDPLTERELEVLKLVARGLNNQEIAETLVISVATVYTHVSNILAKLHLASRTQAALYALREGLASLYDPDESEPPTVSG
jgi:NarL family two-component system response regulator LiaR